MHVPRLVDRALCRRERLPEHLAPEDVLRADVAALAAEQVVLEALEAEQVDQFGDDGFGHVTSGGRARMIAPAFRPEPDRS